MVLDASVIVEIILNQADAAALRSVLAVVPSVLVCSPTMLEAAIVLQKRLDTDPRPMLAALLSEYQVQVQAYSEAHWGEAYLAFERYGKGRHPAKLNFGDCMSYAAAKIAGAPLLYIGKDFAQTDLG